MPSWSLGAPHARERSSVMMIAGSVVVAAAIAQAVANPIVPGDAALTLQQATAIQAPLPTINPVTEAQVAAAEVASFAFRAPTPGYGVNSPFGLRRLPWEPRGRMHEGVDIAAPRGLPVGATLAGVVVRTGNGGGYGRFVELRHGDGLTSLYAHLGSVRRDLKPGMALAAGESVGLVGNTGRSTGEHLHFEIRSEGRPLNPALFMGKTFASVDELPLDAAARFSRRVRLAVVSPQAMARMAPLMASANAAKGVSQAMTTRKDGRVRGVLATGDPSAQAVKAAAVAHGALPPAPQPYAPAGVKPAQSAAPATVALDDFTAQRLEAAS